MGKPPARTYEDIRSILKTRALENRKALWTKYPHVEKFLKDRNIEIGKLREHSAKLIGAGALTGTLLLSPPQKVKILPAAQSAAETTVSVAGDRGSGSQKDLLAKSLKQYLPEKPRPLSREEEKGIEKILLDTYAIPVKATLEGEHLNTTYGYIGIEQHLRRYPGDILSNHAPGKNSNWDFGDRVIREGMAPGLAAWGYFSPSKEKLTGDLVETERWYAVVQTLYLPDWNKRTRYLRDWYKYRKVLIVNTQNGNAVVASVADAGPAAWTGKSFGGSPEVMDRLGGAKYTKGSVLVFFVDDPENKISLGPVGSTALAGVKLYEI